MSIRLFNSAGGYIDLESGGTSATANVFTLPAETGTILTSASDLATQTAAALNATGSAPIYACRAWVNFNGSGTVAIRASGNVSSITDNNTGDYTANFTTAMPDANYAAVGSVSDGVNPRILGVSTLAVGSLRLKVENDAGAAADVDTACVSFFR
jgi:hypothetical protein